MPLSQDKTERISFEVIKVLYSRFDSFPQDALGNRNAPFHAAFLNAFVDKFEGKVSDIPFFISLSSWLQGLNTTLGQTFFENVAHIICDGEKREYTSKKLGNLLIDRQQKEIINTIITDLSTARDVPHLDNEDLKLILEEATEEVGAIDFSADIFIEENDIITAIELKSVRPNSGEMRGEKQKILEGKTALKKAFPNKTIKFLIGFPFDPTSPSNNPCGYNKTRFLSSIINMNKFFHASEVLLASELWDFLSGQANTMESILQIINSIATPEFIKHYEFINDRNNIKDRDQYIKGLIKWNLFSELQLLGNDDSICLAITSNNRLQRIYNQFSFKDGVYNIDRFRSLTAL